MSVAAVAWAYRQRVKRSSAKFTLVTMANHVPPNGTTCRASCAAIAAETGQDRKTVLANIRWLVESGCITDTGGRVGETGQVIVYVLNDPKSGTVEEAQKRDGSLNESGGNSPVSPAKQSRFSAEIVPETGYGKGIEREEQRKRGRDSGFRNALGLDDVTEQVFMDFTALRDAKRAPLTLTAIAGIRREAAKADMSMQQVLETCCQRGWIGFKAEWVQGRDQSGKATARADEFTGGNRSPRRIDEERPPITVEEIKPCH